MYDGDGGGGKQRSEGNGRFIANFNTQRLMIGDSKLHRILCTVALKSELMKCNVFDRHFRDFDHLNTSLVTLSRIQLMNN